VAGLGVTRIPVGELQANAYLLTAPEAGVAALVDPGADPARLLRGIEASGCRLALLLCTHGHFDHVGAAAAVQRAWDLPLLVHPGDAPLIEQLPRYQELFGFPPTAVPRFEPLLADGLSLPLGDARLLVRHVPGHSPGHVMLLWDDDALVGDLIFAGSVGRTDLPGGDQELLASSIRQRVYTLPERTRLHPGHGPATTVGRERATNPFVRPSAAG